MINTLDIGKYIYNKLSADSTLTQMGVHIYPLIADNDAKFPFIIYKRTGLSSSICKDGTYEDIVTMEIKVVTDKYSVGIQIANIIRSLLQKPFARYGDMEISDVSIDFAGEDFIENAFIQTMQLNLKINEY